MSDVYVRQIASTHASTMSEHIDVLEVNGNFKYVLTLKISMKENLLFNSCMFICKHL